MAKMPCLYVKADEGCGGNIEEECERRIDGGSGGRIEGGETEGEGLVTVHITVDNDAAVETSRLLALYGDIDPRVRPLAVTFRCWAQVSLLAAAWPRRIVGQA